MAYIPHIVPPKLYGPLKLFQRRSSLVSILFPPVPIFILSIIAYESICSHAFVFLVRIYGQSPGLFLVELLIAFSAEFFRQVIFLVYREAWFLLVAKRIFQI